MAEQNRLVEFYQRLPQVFSLAAIALGTLGLLGWFFDFALLKSGLPGLTYMKANSALGFILSGVSLWGIQSGAQHLRIVWQAFACAVMLLGLLTLFEYFSGVNFGIDQWLIWEVTNLPGDTAGRMSINSAICFSALGAALLLLSQDKPDCFVAIHALAIVPILGAGAALIGYVFDLKDFLVVILRYKPMALPTAVAFLLLALGVVNARPEYPFRRFMSSDSTAGITVRRLLPATIGFTLATGWLIQQCLHAGYFGEPFALPLFTAASIAGLSTLILWSAGTLSEADAQRTLVWVERRSASQYARSLIEASLDPLVTISTDGKINDVNEATVRAIGVPREELIGSDFSDYFTEPDKARACYQEVFEKVSITDYPLTLRHVSGKLMDVLYNASVFYNDRGEVAGVFAAARDVTERNQAEAQVAQLSLQNRLILDSAGEGIYGLDNDGRCTFVNPAALELLGFSDEELLGQKIHGVIHHTKADGSPYPQDECPVQSAYKLGEVHRGNDMYWRKDGSSLQVGFVSTPIQEGDKTNGAVVVFRDITELQRAEKELRRSEHSLAEAQRIAHLGSWELNLLTNHLQWSDEVFRIFEIDPDSFGDSYEAFLEAIHPDDREMVDHAYRKSVENRTPYNIVHRILMDDGRVKYVNERCETYYDQDGKALNSVGTAHDITERIQAENEIKELNRELEQRVAARTEDLEEANAELESFAYSVSHDLRVPLRAIDGFSRIVLEEYNDKLDAEGQRLLNVVRDNTKKMAQLIDDILGFSRTGRQEMIAAEIDMEGLVRSVLDELKPMLADRQIELKIDPLPVAVADRIMLERVVTNLLANAIKFSRTRPEAKIEVGAIPGDEETVYYVKDNGVGFDMQYAHKLFGVFQRLHGTEEFEGTGIGLAIIKRVITRHGGRVWAEGRVGEGATFYFTLPTKDSAENNIPK